MMLVQWSRNQRFERPFKGAAEHSSAEKPGVSHLNELRLRVSL